MSALATGSGQGRTNPCRNPVRPLSPRRSRATGRSQLASAPQRDAPSSKHEGKADPSASSRQSWFPSRFDASPTTPRMRRSWTRIGQYVLLPFQPSGTGRRTESAGGRRHCSLVTRCSFRCAPPDERYPPDLDAKLIFGEDFSAGPERVICAGACGGRCAGRPLPSGGSRARAVPPNLPGGRSPARRCQLV